MKYKIYVISIIFLVIALLSSWVYFALQCPRRAEASIINSQEEAIQLGIAYMNIHFPDMHISAENFDFYASMDDDVWVVCSLDKVTRISANLPCASFWKDGKVRFIGLQAH